MCVSQQASIEGKSALTIEVRLEFARANRCKRDRPQLKRNAFLAIASFVDCGKVDLFDCVSLALVSSFVVVGRVADVVERQRALVVVCATRGLWSLFLQPRARVGRLERTSHATARCCVDSICTFDFFVVVSPHRREQTSVCVRRNISNERSSSRRCAKTPCSLDSPQCSVRRCGGTQTTPKPTPVVADHDADECRRDARLQTAFSFGIVCRLVASAREATIGLVVGIDRWARSAAAATATDVVVRDAARRGLVVRQVVPTRPGRSTLCLTLLCLSSDRWFCSCCCAH